MLVLSRKKGESVIIDDNIEITVIDVSENGKVKLGINAPKSVSILRKEVKKAVESENREATRKVDMGALKGLKRP
ncbi:carbon storage regulator CsrA [Peptoclostridium litorale]|nr:carbon storage regulator CsrA [Peptoclostridium litorale]